MLKIHKYLESCVGQGVFPGASWAIGNSDAILEKGCVGVLGNGLGPVKEDTIYDMASITKVFVALALMKQFEDGLIRLVDSVEYFLPAYKDCPLGKVNIFTLMTHTAPFMEGPPLYRHVKTREELLEALRLSELRADNSQKVFYTCEAFILLGEIISAIDASSLDEVIRCRVLEPLEMKETCYNPPASLIERIAPTEECPIRGRLIRGEVHDENAWIMGGVSGNAGIFSCAQDMTRIGVAMLNSLESGGFLNKATAELMTRNHTPGMGENRGLCWVVAGHGYSCGDLISPTGFGHTGFTGTCLWIDPERKFYGLLLSNRIHPRRDNTKLFRTRNIFYNLAVLEYG